MCQELPLSENKKKFPSSTAMHCGKLVAGEMAVDRLFHLLESLNLLERVFDGI